jgi:hypothetical protein
MAVITARTGARSWATATDWVGDAKPTDNVDSFIIPADTNNITLPTLKYSVVCGAYFTVASALKFSKILNQNGIANKIVVKDLSRKLYFVTIYQSNDYRETQKQLEKNYSQLKGLGVHGRLWIWNKNKAKNIISNNEK